MLNKKFKKNWLELSVTKQNNLTNQNSFTALKPMCGSRQILKLSMKEKHFLFQNGKMQYKG